MGGDTLRVKASLRAPSSKMSVVSEGFAGKQGGSFSGGSEETYLENPKRLGKGAFSFLAFLMRLRFSGKSST